MIEWKDHIDEHGHGWQAQDGDATLRVRPARIGGFFWSIHQGGELVHHGLAAEDEQAKRDAEAMAVYA